MPNIATYAVRKNALEQERLWQLGGGGLAWQAPDHTGRFSCRDIAKIRLEWTGSRVDHARYACHVTRSDGWTGTIVSTSYVAFGQFEDRSQAYRDFVVALVREAAQHNPGCQFLAGASWFKYVANLASMIAGLLALAAILLLAGLPLTGLIVAKLLLLAFLLPLALRWIRSNLPRRFNPSDIPAGVLPSP